MRKKTMLRLMILALAAILLLSGTVLAVEPTYTITIDNATQDYTYAAYQVFSGDLSGNVLSNVEWGTGVNGSDLLTALQRDDTIGSYFTSCTTAADVANVLATLKTGDSSNFANDSANLDAFAAIVDSHLTTSSGECSYAEGKYTISNLSAGYYFVKNTAVPTISGAYTKFMLNLIKNVTITPKAGVPTFNKKVQDADDTAGTTTGWQDSADHDIGDMVNFQLTGTVASNYDAYETYQFTFHDHQSDGLTFDADSVVVKVGDQKINDGYQVVTEGLEDGCTFEIVFDDLKDIASVQAGSVITVTYQSELDDSAVIGSTGNPNTAHLEFSNNPNDEQEGETGKTPDDTVIVFTYKTVINKVDSNKTPLAGAAFKLEKFIEGEEGSDTYQEAKGTWTLVEEITAEEDKTNFTFSGLDDGVYRLTETTTPDGYNTIDPIIFTVTATHDVTSDNPALQSLSGDAASGEIAFTASKDDGELTSSVVNQSGLELPETGGMGTTIFYIVGGLLVVGAAVLLITKKRMSQKS